MTLLDALSEGPARLSGDDVTTAQRRRLVAAMIAAAAEKGYAGVSVSDVVGRARVSRATFYELFDSKEDCFLAAFNAAVEDLVRGIGARAVSDMSPRERIRGLLAAYLETLAAFPEIARVCLVEIYGAGEAGAALRRDMQQGFVALVKQQAEAVAATGEAVRMPSDFEIEALVGAISSLVTIRVATGEAATLPSLLDPLEAFIVRVFSA